MRRMDEQETRNGRWGSIYSGQFQSGEQGITEGDFYLWPIIAFNFTY